MVIVQEEKYILSGYLPSSFYIFCLKSQNSNYAEIYPICTNIGTIYCKEVR